MIEPKLLDSSKDLFIGGLVYFKSCREVYLHVMEGRTGSLMDSSGMSPHAMMEGSIKLYISIDIAVTPVALLKKFYEDLKRLPPSNLKLINAYMDVFSRIEKKDTFTEQLCMSVMREVSKTTVLKDTVDKLKNLRSVSQVQETLQNLSGKLSGINSPGKIRMFNPVQSAEELLVHRDKVPTGVSFIDHLLGGGITFGEHGGCLGASGSGKSTIANMLVCNMAIQGYNAMLLQFEQSVVYNSDILARIYSYLTGLPRSEYADKSFSELSEKAKEALKKCEKISNNIRVASFTDDNAERSVDTIITAIKDSIDAGFRPNLVIIDWLGAVVSDFLQTASGTDANYPIIAQFIQDKLMSFGKAEGISFFFLHQLSNDAASKPPSYKPNRFDSYFFRGFAQKLEYCLEIGNKSKQHDGKFACWLNCDKVRGAEPDKSVIVLLDGANAKMQVTKDGEYVINSKGQFTSVARMLSDANEVNALDTTPTGVDSYMDGFR